MKTKNEIMLGCLLVLIGAGQIVSGIGSYEITIDEDASQVMEGLSISNDTTLVVKTSLYEDYAYSKVSIERCRSVPRGSLFSLSQGETLYFHVPGVWGDSRLTFLPPSTNNWEFLPREFRGESKMILLRKRRIDYFISPSLQRAYSTNNNCVTYFKFPYQSIWKNIDEYHSWLSGIEFRSRRSTVEERARREKSFGEGFYSRLMAMSQTPEMVSALQGSTATNIQVAVEGDLTNGIPSQVEHVQVWVSGDMPDRHVSSVRFQFIQNGLNICRYCYDRDGRLRWFATERAVPGDNGKTVLEDPWIFELDEAGAIVRSFDPGTNPLLVITDRTFYFSGENSRLDRFFDDARRAMKEVW